MNPVKKQPNISPNPKTTIAFIDYSYCSLVSVSLIVEVSIDTKTPE
jgi:hypothetical protein